MTMKPARVKIRLSKRALSQRINRHLKKQNEYLCACRENWRGYTTVGDHYVIDTSLNAIVHKHVNIEDFAREIGVIKPYECLEEE
jgi:hypothetical protein